MTHVAHKYYSITFTVQLRLLYLNNANHPILREEVEAAVKWLKKGKSAGVDNVLAELIQQGGEAMVNALLIICNKIWRRGEWPTPCTQSLVIAFPKNGNLQLCQNYRTISPISHPSKVMLKIILNRLRDEYHSLFECQNDALVQYRSHHIPNYCRMRPSMFKCDGLLSKLEDKQTAAK